MQYLPYRYWALSRPSSTAILRNFIPLMVSPVDISLSDKRYTSVLLIFNIDEILFEIFVFEKSGFIFEKSGIDSNGGMVGVFLITLPFNPFVFCCAPVSDNLLLPFNALSPAMPTIPPILGLFFSALKGLNLPCALMFMHTMVKTRAKKVLDNRSFRFIFFVFSLTIVLFAEVQLTLCKGNANRAYRSKLA